MSVFGFVVDEEFVFFVGESGPNEDAWEAVAVADHVQEGLFWEFGWA